MHYQDIVISPDVFEKIRDDILSIDFRSYKENLELKKLITSKEIEERIKHVYLSAGGDGKKAIDYILRIFEKSDKFKTVDENSFDKMENDKLTNSLLNLAFSSESKIVNTTNLGLKLYNSPYAEK